MTKKFVMAAAAVLTAASLLTGCSAIKQLSGNATADDIGLDMTSFTAADMDGNEVTQDIFKDYDITMVNVWETTCQFCVEEMPYLEKMYNEELPDNVNLISICQDANDDPETAAQEIADTGVTFTTIAGNDELNSMLSNLVGHPTTFFVDSQGNAVGTLISGAPGDDEQSVIDAYMEKINEALTTIGK